jgi:hypothetical protein
MKFKFILFIFLLFSNLSFSQNEDSTIQDSSSWIVLKNAAHKIGFCIYHPSKNYCSDHSNEFAERDKNTPEDEETYYFEMKKEWAQNRLDKWAERHEQPVENLLILFDVSQKHSLNKSEPEKTINSDRGFVWIDLTDTIDFTFHKKNKGESMMMIKSDGKNALMENFLWREFMTGRLGRFNPKIDFKLIGENRKTGFEKFKEAFFIFQKENNG